MKMYDEASTGAVLRARQLRRDSTDAERKLWAALRAAFPDFKWRRQMPVGPYVVDFACFAERLIIEVDGSQHAQSETDAVRTRFLDAQGFRILRFWNSEVTENIDGVLHTIAAALPSSPFRGSAAPSLSQGRG